MHQMDNFSNVGSHFSHQHKNEHMHDPRAASAMDQPLMTGTLQSHASTAQPTFFMPNGSMLNALPQQQPLVMTSSASMNMLSGGMPILANYPTQPLPPAPPPSTIIQNAGPHLIQQNHNGFNRNMSTDSFGGVAGFNPKIMDSPQLSSSGRGSGRNDSSDSQTGGRPVTPTQQQQQRPNSRPVTPTGGQPLGLPVNRGKLVPGRMSNTKLDNNKPRREVPSTAV